MKITTPKKDAKRIVSSFIETCDLEAFTKELISLGYGYGAISRGGMIEKTPIRKFKDAVDDELRSANIAKCRCRP